MSSDSGINAKPLAGHGSARHHHRQRPAGTIRPWAAILLPFCLLLVSCGGSEPAGTVSGKVTLNDEPVTAGQVGFISTETGEGATAEIQPDGSFQLGTPLPPGTYTVTVVPPPPPPPTEATMNDPPPVSSLPQKYRSSETSDLKFEIAEGSNSFDVKLVE